MSDKTRDEARSEGGLHDPGRYSKADGSPGGEPGGYEDETAETQRRADGANQAAADASGYPDPGVDAYGDADGETEEVGQAAPSTYEAMTLADLQDVARERGVTHAGVRKAELIAALEESDAANGDEA